jgi:hypothetical protein
MQPPRPRRNKYRLREGNPTVVEIWDHRRWRLDASLLDQGTAVAWLARRYLDGSEVEGFTPDLIGDTMRILQNEMATSARNFECLRQAASKLAAEIPPGTRMPNIVDEPWSSTMFETAVAMKQWPSFVRAVDRERSRIWTESREAEADRLAGSMDMTPEGYVREWDKRGRRTSLPLEPWEHAYQRVGLVEKARELGYIAIDRSPRCEVSLEPRGHELLSGESRPKEQLP